MNKCFKCGTEFEGSFCPNCGTKYEETKICPQCGAQLDGHVRFCNHCGYNFANKPKKNAVGKAIKDFAQKSKAWLIAHKTLAIIVAAVIFVGIVLAIVLPLTVGNVFRANRLARINVGDDYKRVERVLGKPYKSSEYQYEYFGNNILKKLKELDKLNEQMDKIEDFDDLDKFADKEEKLKAEIEALEYKHIAVSFSDGKVTKVEMNTHAKQNEATQPKWQEGNAKQKVKFVPDKVPNGLTPDMIDVVARIYYADGSYRMNKIQPTSEGDAKNGWTLTWRDDWGEYSWKIFASTDKPKLMNDSDIDEGYQLFRLDDDHYILKVKYGYFFTNGSWEYMSEYYDKIFAVYVDAELTYITQNAFDGLTQIKFAEYDNGIYLGGETNPYQSLWMLKSNDITSIEIHPDTQTIMDDVFRDFDGLTEVVIPDNVSIVGREAFYGCDNLTKLSVPDSIANIGKDAFKYCNKLVYNEYENANYLGNDSNPYAVLVTSTSTDITACNVHQNTKYIMPYAFYECTQITSANLPNGLRVIDDGVFEGCTNLASVTIPDGVIRIGDASFSDCISLTSVTIPDSVTDIGEGAFSGCTKLASVKLSNSLTIINDEMFWGCSLTSIVIPDGVTYIGSYAFSGCNLTNVTLPQNVETVSVAAFAYCSKLANVTLSEKLSWIDKWAFYECTSITNITIPKKVRHIGEEAFSGCTNLTSVTFKRTKHWYASSSRDGSGEIVDFESKELSNVANAAKLLTSTYVKWHWGVSVSD